MEFLEKEFGASSQTDRVERAGPLKFFSPFCEDTVVKCDASGVGLGCVLLQNGKPIMFASRKLTSVESRYSQIEKEFLALLFACQRFRGFLLGMCFRLKTDNKPIVSFFKKNIDSLPVRIQRWMLALQTFNFSIEHIPGKSNTMADELSRNPNSISDASKEEDGSSIVCFVLNELPVSVAELTQSTLEDSELQLLKSAINKNWNVPNSHLLNKYRQWKDQLSITDNLIVMGHRILIPSTLRNKILHQAHVGHPGLNKMKETMRTYCIWPGMSIDIENFSKECEACARFSKCNNSAPLEPVAEKVSEIWHTIGIDFTGPSSALRDNTLFTIIDYASRFPFAIPVRSSDAKSVVDCLKNIFSIFGIPKIIVSDNGPAFISREFKQFTNKCYIKHHFASAYYPQSNGVVERLHGSIKYRLQKLLYDGHDFQSSLRQILFDLRSNLHSSTGKSPFSLMFGREMNGFWQ